MTLTIAHRNLTWLEHAEKHFYSGYHFYSDSCNPADEHLMYICLFAYFEPVTTTSTTSTL